MTDVPDETAVASDTQGRPQRDRHPTMKALVNEVKTKTKDLQAEWRKTEQALTNLRQSYDDEEALNANVSSQANDEESS